MKYARFSLMVLLLAVSAPVYADSPQWTPKNIDSGNPNGWTPRPLSSGDTGNWSPGRTSNTSGNWTPTAEGKMNGGSPTTKWGTGGTSQANDSVNSYMRPNFGTANDMTNKVVTPMRDGAGAQLKTLDGSFGMNVKVGAPTGNPFLKIRGMLNLVLGEISLLNIQVDGDMDGKANNTVNLPLDAPSMHGLPISGACQNGFVNCVSGTTSCTYTSFSVSNNQVVFKPAGLADLSGCFCFSTACTKHNGSAIFNLATILRDMSTPLAQTYLATMPNISITGIESGSEEVDFYGQIVATAQSAGNSSQASAGADMSQYPDYSGDSSIDLTSYYGDRTAQASGDGDTELAKQKSNPNSMYNLVSSVIKQGISTKTCTKHRGVYIKPNQSTYVSDVTGQGVTDHRLYGGIFGSSPTDLGDYSFVFWNSQGTQGPWGTDIRPPSTLDPATNPLAAFTVAHVLKSDILATLPGAVGVKPISASYTLKTTCIGCGTTADVTASWAPGVSFPVQVEANGTYGQSGVQSFNYNGHIEITTLHDDLQESVNDTCGDLEAKAKTGDCKLKDEVWDGNRTVVQNYVPTNSVLGQMKVSVSGQVRSYDLYRQWLDIKKAYVCVSNSDDYTDKINQAMQKISSMTTATSISFNGNPIINYNNGFGSSSIKVNGFFGQSQCPPMCKTKRMTTKTAVNYTGGVVVDTKSASAMAKDNYEYTIKDCVLADDGTGSCPVDAASGETVVEQCGCLQSDLNEIAAAVNAIQTLKDDIICSQE